MESKNKKRYEALYINPNFCDGFWDNEKTKYLDVEEVKEKLYENLENGEIEEILNRTGIEENFQEDNKKMSDVGFALKGLGLLLLGIFGLVWTIIKLICCIIMAGFISIKLGIGGYYWWCSSIIIFCILHRIVNSGKLSESYSKLIDEYNEEGNGNKIE